MKIVLISSLAYIFFMAGCAKKPIPEMHIQHIENSIVESKMIINSPEYKSIMSKINLQMIDHSADKKEDLKNDNGLDILKKLKTNISNISINNIQCTNPWYAPFNFMDIFSSTVAWDGNGMPLLRCSKLSRNQTLWAGTFIHETSHNIGYLHNGNDRKGNECTVPYIVGDLAEFVSTKYLQNKKWIPENEICGNIKTVINSVYQENNIKYTEE